MNVKTTAFALVILVWIIGVFLGSTFDGYGSPGSAYAWAGNSTAANAGGYAVSPITTLDYLTNFDNAFKHTAFVGDITMPVPNGKYWNAWIDVMTWKFSFMGNFAIAYWIVFAPFYMPILVGFAMIVFRIIRGNVVFGG